MKKYILLFLLSFVALLSRAISITGIIKDEKGKGLKGVRVSIEGLAQAPAITDGSGDFIINIQNPLYTPGTPIIFQLDLKDYDPETPNLLRQHVPNPNIPNSHVVLIMKKIESNNHIKVIGYIEMDKNQPVSGVTVSVYETGQTIQSDNNGAFSIFLSKKLINTDITFRTIKENFSSSPKSYTLTASPRPLIIKMIPETNAQVAQNTSNAFVPTIKPNSRSSYLNFFVKEGDPTHWFERAKLFKFDESDTRRKEDDDNNFQFKRYYSSSNNREMSVFGYGWRHSLESKILVNNSTLGNINYMHYDGTILSFKPTVDVDHLIKDIKALMPGVTENTTLEEIIQYEIDKGKNILGTLNSVLYIGIDLFVGKIKILPRGFQFSKNKNSYFLYDKEGRLESIEEKGIRPLRIIYNISGHIEGITNRKSITQFRYNESGLVHSINYDDTLTVHFLYDGGKRLSQVTCKDTTRSIYQYDSANRMVLFYDRSANDTIKIGYNRYGQKILKRNRERKITWEFKTSPDTIEVSQVITYFREESDEEPDDDYYKQSINYKFVKDSKEIYMFEKDKDLKIYKIAACGCNTLEVSIRGDVTKYEYNFLGYVINKTEGGKITKLSYNDLDKVDTVRTFSSAINKITEEAIFSYDAEGNLVRATNIAGDVVDLKYDEKARIIEMSVKYNKNSTFKPITINFEYNEISKPSKIAVKGEGSLSVTYTKDGEVKNVDNDGPGKIALNITSAFQTLLEIIRPAGVTIDTGFTTITL